MRRQNYTFRYRKFGANASLGSHPFSVLDHDFMNWSYIPNFRVFAFDSPIHGAGLFSLELEGCSEAVDRLSRFVNEYAEKRIEIPEVRREFDVHLFLAKNVIYPLTGYCCLSTRDHNKARDKQPSLFGDIKVKGTGLGDEFHTWHGYLDMISKITIENDHHAATPVAVAQPSLTDSFLSEDGFEGGVPCEVKRDEELRKHVPQTAAQTIIYSFVHHRRRPHENTLVPGILITKDSFLVVMYDCVNDILLELTRSVKFLSETGEFSLSSIAFLWTVLHHSLFLNSIEYKAAIPQERGTLKEAKASFCDWQKIFK
ncbi:uncharacterized protein [Oscarella lobularis]|uniref:uncharacterized protein n=1 Tax=Oscarella lobularis TaxID=121494 RepID=UPI0033137BC4